jgi:hypothetical protein
MAAITQCTTKVDLFCDSSRHSVPTSIAQPSRRFLKPSARPRCCRRARSRSRSRTTHPPLPSCSPSPPPPIRRAPLPPHGPPPAHGGDARRRLPLRPGPGPAGPAVGLPGGGDVHVPRAAAPQRGRGLRHPPLQALAPRPPRSARPPGPGMDRAWFGPAGCRRAGRGARGRADGGASAGEGGGGQLGMEASIGGGHHAGGMVCCAARLGMTRTAVDHGGERERG